MTITHCTIVEEFGGMDALYVDGHFVTWEWGISACILSGLMGNEAFTISYLYMEDVDIENWPTLLGCYQKSLIESN